MNRTMKLAVGVACMALLAAAAWAGPVNPTGFPLVNEPVTLKGFGQAHPYQGPREKMLVFQEMEKLTNIRFAWEVVPDAGWDERKALKFATNDIPDVWYRARLTETELNTYGPAGVLLDMSKYLDTYAPNIAALFKRDPTLKLTSADGGLYSLPQVEEVFLSKAHRFYINKKWLDTLKLPVPTTLDQYLSTLIAFRDKDPNGNGKQDEIGLSDFSTDNTRFVFTFMGAWGLGNRGTGLLNQTGCDVGPDGNIRYIWTEPRMKEIYVYLNRLWKERLIDPNIFTHSTADYGALGATDRLGSHPTNNIAFMAPHVEDWTWLMPLTGPYGDRQYNHIASKINVLYTFSLSAKCKYPEAMMRWVDYFYSEPGFVLLMWGKEGVTYTKTRDGYAYVDSIAKNPNMDQTQARAQFTPLVGGSVPYLYTMDLYKKYPWANKQFPEILSDQSLDAYQPFFPKENIVGFTYNKDEAKLKDEFMVNAGQYVKEMREKFITGDVPITEWDNYVKKVKSLNYDAYLKMLNGVYERFKKNR